MVRIRKNANDLTPAERDRFLTALVTLNQQGNFVDFQNMHTADTSMEIHGRSCFLPWHRLYLLDLERKLQTIDPSVVLPYWKFDEPAPNVFTRDFLGRADTTGIVQFSSSNPLVNWRLSVFGEGSGRISRTPVPNFDPASQPAPFVQNDEAATLNLGTTPGTGQVTFENFERVEGDPHGSAHVSFRGQVADIGRAPADPLFFLVHANVDRLWAKWQWLQDRADPDDDRAYYKQGLGPNNPDPRRAGADRIGNYLDDSLWPWCGLVGDPRPRTAPGTYFPISPFLSVPDRFPLIREAIDFQGQNDLAANLGFSYDDVPFDFE
jgi:tyrosinase